MKAINAGVDMEMVSRLINQTWRDLLQDGSDKTGDNR